MSVDLSSADELERFIAQLQQFTDELATRTSNLRGHWGQLGEVWRDQQYLRFAGDWEETLQSIDAFLQSAPEMVTHLQGKLALARRFQE